MTTPSFTAMTAKDSGMADPSSDLQAALNAVAEHRSVKQFYTDYYNGAHRLLFASDTFRSTFGDIVQSMRDNLCPIIVEAPADRMEVINFASAPSASQKGSPAQTMDAAWDIWQRENMDLVSYDTHVEALKTGEAYVIVWSDDTGRARFFLQDSRNCAIIKDPATDRPLYGVKMWMAEGDRTRLNLYYPDRTERYITASKLVIGDAGGWKASKFSSVTDEEPITPNVYGIVPMFKFETNPVLANAIPLQDALNKTVCDRLVAMEFAAFKQRWATGIEMPTDDAGHPITPFKAGQDRVWASAAETTKFGEFQAANLLQFLKVADDDRLEMARVSGVPVHFFSVRVSDAISGEALKTLESRFTKRVSRLCRGFGTVWASAMQLALLIEGQSPVENLAVQWATPEHRSEKEWVETLALKRTALDVPVDTLREEYGYTPEDIAKFNKADRLEFDEPQGFESTNQSDGVTAL